MENCRNGETLVGGVVCVAEGRRGRVRGEPEWEQHVSRDLRMPWRRIKCSLNAGRADGIVEAVDGLERHRNSIRGFIVLVDRIDKAMRAYADPDVV